MTIKFGVNLLSNSVQRNLNTTANELSTVSERLSTGLRINKASDDAAGLAIAKSLNVDSRVFNQALRNLNDGASFINIADAATSELTNIVIRIEELAAQAANGTLSDPQRGSLQKEVTALQDELNRIVKATDFNGRSILTGTSAKTVLQGGYGMDSTLTVQVGAKQLEGGIEGFAGGTERVSTSSAGAEATGGASSRVNISADGRYIVFQSSATNLIAGDSNGLEDIFRKDLLTGEVIRVNTTSSGQQAVGGASQTASISADGRYVVFHSTATNLVSGDTNGSQDIFRKDLLTGEIVRVSTSSSGGQASSWSQNASISSDGRYVVFESEATNLVEGDTNAIRDIFRKDLLTGETIIISTTSNGVQSTGGISFVPNISADGRYVVFSSDATNLVSGDSNAQSDIFLKDILTGLISRVNTSSSGIEAAGGGSFNPIISADSRYVIFDSNATNLVGADTNGQRDIFRKDLLTGETIRVNTSNSGSEASGGTTANAKISADGRYVVFDSNAGNLVDQDTNGTWDIFRKDITTGEILRLSTTSSGLQSTGGSSERASISADGRQVVFSSTATNLVSGDTNAVADIFLRDLTRTGIQEMSGMVVSNQAAARVTLELAKQYREELSQYRSSLGASSSRLSTFMSTLDSTKLNYQAAESRISDADIAEEAAASLANQIKQKVSAALLAQANQVPQLGLRLLENL